MEVEDTKMDYTNSDRLLETLTSHEMNYNLGKDSKKKANSLAQLSIEKSLKTACNLQKHLADMKTKVERKPTKAHVSEAWLESRIIDLQIKDGWLAMRLIPEA